MKKHMEFLSWFLKEESLPNQIRGIVDAIAGKFKIGGLPYEKKLKFQMNDLEQEQKTQGNMVVPTSVKTSLEQLGEIRNMKPDQKKTFDDMMKDLPLTTTLGTLAEKIVAIISGQQKKV